MTPRSDKLQLNKLVAKSDAAFSLTLESTLAYAIRRKEWSVRHSWYYEDVVSKKTREIDIAARYYRRYRNLGRTNNIVVECKSIRDPHILFSSPPAHHHRELPYWWIGTDDLLRQRLITELINRNASAAQIEFFLANVKRRSYLHHFWRTYPVRIDDPPIEKKICGF